MCKIESWIGLLKGTSSTTVEENSRSSASGHQFTVDDSSIYWTQQAHEDQQPQFKNVKKPSVVVGPPSIESLQRPPTVSLSSSSIYKTDDQHNSLSEDNSRKFWQKEDVTVAAMSRKANSADSSATFNQDKKLQQEIENTNEANDIKNVSELDKVSLFVL